jgi:nucleotide-binding universal stress UspA family protein
VLVTNTLVRLSNPVEEILKVADEEKCDAIVLGSHGKGFLKQAFLGSVSSAVLHRSKKPVFIIPIPTEKESLDWDAI